MKILHALVGYLAVTSLPFHPFAFASPLAIDYDGYVQNRTEGALMKHVLDNILETCQTVTMQNHSDTALTKRRVPGDTQVIDARQEVPVYPTATVPELLIIGVIVAAVIFGLVWLGDDNNVRCNVV